MNRCCCCCCYRPFHRPNAWLSFCCRRSFSTSAAVLLPTTKQPNVSACDATALVHIPTPTPTATTTQQLLLVLPIRNQNRTLLVCDTICCTTTRSSTTTTPTSRSTSRKRGGIATHGSRGDDTVAVVTDFSAVVALLPQKHNVQADVVMVQRQWQHQHIYSYDTMLLYQCNNK